MSVYINFLFVFLLLEFVGESELAYNMKRKLDLQTAVTLCKFFNQYTGTDNEQLSPHGLTLNDDQSNPGPSRRAVPLHSGHGEYYILLYFVTSYAFVYLNIILPYYGQRVAMTVKFKYADEMKSPLQALLQGKRQQVSLVSKPKKVCLRKEVHQEKIIMVGTKGIRKILT